MTKTIYYLLGTLFLLNACAKKDEVKPEVKPDKPKTEEPAKKPQGDNQPIPPKADDQPKEPQKEQPSDPKTEPKTPEEPKSNRPSDYTLGSRLMIRWQEGMTPLKSLDLDALIAGDASSLSLDKLRPYLHIYSSHTDGTPYTLTQDELKDVSIEQIRYQAHEVGEDEILFKAKYKSISAQAEQRLTFSRQEYFAHRIGENKAEIQTKYLRGVYDQLAVYGSSLLTYDESKYRVEVLEEGKQYSDSQNELTFEVRIYLARHANKLAARARYTLSGFKPLSDLKGNLRVTAQPELRDYLQKYKTRREDLSFLNSNIRVWQRYLKYFVRLGENNYVELLPKSENPFILVGTREGRNDLRTLVLEQPRFEVTKVELLANGYLEYTLQLRGVNDGVSFDHFTLSFTVLPR